MDILQTHRNLSSNKGFEKVLNVKKNKQIGDNKKITIKNIANLAEI